MSSPRWIFYQSYIWIKGIDHIPIPNFLVFKNFYLGYCFISKVVLHLLLLWLMSLRNEWWIGFRVRYRTTSLLHEEMFLWDSSPDLLQSQFLCFIVSFCLDWDIFGARPNLHQKELFHDARPSFHGLDAHLDTIYKLIHSSRLQNNYFSALAV